MTSDSHLYRTFIDLNQSSFDAQLFIVSYHALSAASYCALQNGDTDHLRQVELLAKQQLQALCDRFGEQPALREPLEVTLYTSLLRIANPRQRVVLDGHLSVS